MAGRWMASSAAGRLVTCPVTFDGRFMKSPLFEGRLRFGFCIRRGGGTRSPHLDLILTSSESPFSRTKRGPSITGLIENSDLPLDG